MTEVYCAGPLFNDAEKREMAEIAAVLENAGYSTFLPQRDGIEYMEMARLAQGEEASTLLWKAIFCLDVHRLYRSDIVVANLNGRVPDEGTVVEMALAFGAGIPVIAHKKDSRSVFGGADNLMILGLCACWSDDIASLPSLARQTLETRPGLDKETASRIGQGVVEALGERSSLSPEQLLSRLADAVEGGQPPS
mgnify:CR=1 FL=1